MLCHFYYASLWDDECVIKKITFSFTRHDYFRHATYLLWFIRADVFFLMGMRRLLWNNSLKENCCIYVDFFFILYRISKFDERLKT